MILSPMLFNTAHFSQLDDREVAAVRTFLSSALPEGSSSAEIIKDPEGYRPLLRPERRRYKFSNSGFVEIDAATRRIVYFNSGNETNEQTHDENQKLIPRGIDDNQAATLTQRLYGAAGWPQPIEITMIEDERGGNGKYIEVHFAPLCQGVPYLADFTMTLSRQAGEAEVINLGILPSPPPKMIPLGTPEDARLAAFRAALAWKGGGLGEGEYGPLRLYVGGGLPQGYLARRGRSGGVVADAHDYQSYTPAEVADALAGRGRLVYAGSLRAADGTPVYVRLDARTGHVLQMQTTNFGAGGLSGGRQPRPVSVPTTLRPWRVGTGRGGWGAWTAPVAAALSPSPSRAPVGKKILLSDGRAAFAAAYDPKTGLLAIGRKAYRPGPALASLLSKRTK